MIINSLQYNGICRCGKEHRMETEFAIIESGCLKNLADYYIVDFADPVLKTI